MVHDSFAPFFSTYFGGFGFIPGNIYAAFISSFVVNAIGPIFGYLQEYDYSIEENHQWQVSSMRVNYIHQVGTGKSPYVSP